MTFNPTLVQFKHTEETLEEMNVETFNPTLVQFKHEKEFLAVVEHDNFQSYLSPIQTANEVHYFGSQSDLSILP